MDRVPKVSVIVPIFDGARYVDGIAELLDMQTFRDFEVLLCVDVNSTDGTMEKAKEACARLKDCRVIEQTDGKHLAGNRNAGLREARGEFVWFCDVDDTFSPDLLAECVRIQAEDDADIVCFNAVNLGPDAEMPPKWSKREYPVIRMGREEALAQWSPKWVPVTAWSKLFRRSLIDGLFFEDSLAEDVVYTYASIDRAERISVYLRPLYGYRKTPHSVTRTPSREDRRGTDEIAAYDLVDGVDAGEGSEALRRANARMKMRSSGHLSYRTFMEYAKSARFREMYGKYLKGDAESALYRHLPTLYYVTIRFYLRFIYKRSGSTYMSTKL